MSKKYIAFRQLKVVQWLGSLFFYILFTLTAFVLVILGLPLLFIKPKLLMVLFTGLTRASMVLMRICLGVRFRFENVNILNEVKSRSSCFIIACKHQSEIETLIFSHFLRSFCIVYKKEINKVPIVGYYMRKAKFISVDRRAGKQAMKSLMDQARQACQDGRPILIFPEGTRIPFGQVGQYHRGVVMLQQALQVPILPVVHNAGRLFPAHAFIKKPGIITFRFLPPMEPDSDADRTLSQLSNTMESECLTLK